MPAKIKPHIKKDRALVIIEIEYKINIKEALGDL